MALKMYAAYAHLAGQSYQAAEPGTKLRPASPADDPDGVAGVLGETLERG